MISPDILTKKSDGDVLKSMVGELFERIGFHSDVRHEWFKKYKTMTMLVAVEVKEVTYELGSGGPLEHYQCSFFTDFGEKNTKLLNETFMNLNEFRRKYRKIDARDRVRAKFLIKADKDE